MDAKQISEIISLYKKHGWDLRRVLLSPALSQHLAGGPPGLFGDARIVESDIDAAWFSRSARPGNETWELRRLTNEPFALCEVFSDEDEEETREEAMYEMESKLRQ